MLSNSNYCKHCGNMHLDQDCAVNPTVFEWKYEGTNIKLYGSWSQFQVAYELSKSKHPPYFLTTQINPPLPPGTYQYIFNVDGVWKHDPNECTCCNSYGSSNNEITVLPRRQLQIDSDENDDDCDEDEILFQHNQKESVKVTIKTYIDCTQVFVKGSWDNWQAPILLKRKFLKFAKKYINYAGLHVLPGSYQYKFIIADQWVYDQTLPTISNGYDSKNNIIHVPKKPLGMLPQNLDKVYFAQYQISHKFERIQGLSMTAIGNELYLFGGRGMGFDYKNDLYILNPRTKDLRFVYDSKGIPPEQRAFHNAIRYGNKIIFYGGLNSEHVFNDYHVYNTTNKTWTSSQPKGQIPAPREKSSLTLLSNYQILVQFGGYYCSHDLEVQQIFNDLHCLDLTSMIWTKYEVDGVKPQKRSAHTATQLKDRIYLFGGQSLPQGHTIPNFNDLWMIDFSQENASWVDLTSLTQGQPPSPRHGHHAAQLQHQIFIIGGRGENANELMNDIYHFDPTTLTWTKPEVQGTIPIPRCYFAGETLQSSELWLVGGHKGNQISNQQLRAHIYVMTFEEVEEDETQAPFSPQYAGFKKQNFLMDEYDSIVPSKTK